MLRVSNSSNVKEFGKKNPYLHVMIYGMQGDKLRFNSRKVVVQIVLSGF